MNIAAVLLLIASGVMLIVNAVYHLEKLTNFGYFIFSIVPGILCVFVGGMQLAFHLRWQP